MSYNCKVGDVIRTSLFPAWADVPTWEVDVMVIKINRISPDGRFVREADGIVIRRLQTKPSLGQMLHGTPGPRPGTTMKLVDDGPSYYDVEFRPVR